MYLYDLRSPASPLAVIPGHTRAVSYVRFISPSRLVSASTDSTLRVWDVAAASAGAGAAACQAVLSGHTNEKNFVGLAASPDGYVMCGAETNEVVAYHSATPTPVCAHDMGAAAALQVRGQGGVFLGGGAQPGT